MAYINIKNDPSLTKERVTELFQNHFKGKYEVYPAKVIGFDFWVKKGAACGVGVKVTQKNGAPALKYFGQYPSAFVRLLMLGLIPYLFLRPGLKRLENEVAEFARTSPELRIPQA
jgi:hypothetical protein